MSFNCAQFRRYIVQPALDDCQHFASVRRTKFAEDLLVATAAQESGLGHWLHQTGSGPAVGIFQTEPATVHDLQRNYIDPAKNADGTPRFAKLLRSMSALAHPLEDEIIWNLRLAATICRLHYLRWETKLAMPPDTTLQNLWSFYKPFYNSEQGAASLDSFSRAIATYTDMGDLVEQS